MSVRAIQQLVAAAREKFALDFPSSPTMFGAPVWEVISLHDRTVNRSNRRIYFARYANTGEPLPAEYANVVKSWLILNRRSARNMGQRLGAARMLWEAILARRAGDPGAFHWDKLSEEDLSQAELVMRSHWEETTTYKLTASMLVFTRFLADRGVCRPLYYTPQTPRVEDLNRHTIAGQQARRDRLPTETALNGLADIYRELANEPNDKLRMAALAILVVSGLRISELLTLPFDCEVEEARGGQPRYGLRYYREKTRGGAKMLAVRWLTATGADLARQAIRQIREITHEARERARILEQSPQRVPIPGFHWSARMTADEVAQALGLRRGSVFRISSERLARHRDRRGFFYRASEVEAYLRSLRAERLWTVDRRDGTQQMLSESLLIAFRGFFQTRKEVSRLLVEPVLISQMNDFGAGRGTQLKSVFQRFGIREPNGAFCRLTTHQFRHWLNHIADRGGLPVDLQTRWLGRENPKDTEAYRHASVDERLEWVKAGIRDGKLSGLKAEIYFELSRKERAVYLEGEIQAVHFTAFGLCLHDFALTPCPYHLNCVRGCPDYLRTKGDMKERHHLIQIRQATEQALQAARSQSAVIAEPWIRHCEETLDGIGKALSVDDRAELADGALARIPPPSRSHGPTQRS
jgi:hypothetical protein